MKSPIMPSRIWCADITYEAMRGVRTEVVYTSSVDVNLTD